MTELHDLLEHAAGPKAAPSAAELQADVARGMRALRRRRTGAAGGLVTVAVAAAAIPVALAGGGPSSGGVAPGGSLPASSSSSTSPGATSAEAKASAAQAEAEATRVKQAAEQAAREAAQLPWRADGQFVPIHTYTGPDLPGSFQLGLMPEGAVVQGGSTDHLTLARAGDPDTDPNSFVGKVVVMLYGGTAPATPEVQQPDEFGSVVVVPLDHPIDGVSAFEVQYPRGVGWSDDEALKFATGITVLPSATAGKG